MKRLRYNAPPHHTLHPNGSDSDPVKGGEEFDCPEEQAEELLTSPHFDVTEVASDLHKLKREQLNKLAEEAGVQNPGSLRTKDAVIAAIENQPAADGEGQNDNSQED